MPRYRMCIAYDGSGYAGWQLQPAAMTVQERIELALERYCGARPRVHGSGRTDQGVHARRQVAHVDLVAARPPAAIRTALNALLPADIRILSVARVRHDFHARRSAVGKEYRYFIWNGDVVPPFLRHCRTPVRDPLDVDRMRAAAALLTGRHDFAAFTANPNRLVESTVRTITELSVRRRGREITIVVAGDGFLYKMVRSLAGFLIRVGQGAVDPETAETILASRERTARVPTAAAQGLFLWRVKY